MLCIVINEYAQYMNFSLCRTMSIGLSWHTLFMHYVLSH